MDISLSLSNNSCTSTGDVKYDSQHRVCQIDSQYFQNGNLVKTHHDIVSYKDGMRFDNWTDTFTQNHQVIHGSSSCIYP